MREGSLAVLHVDPPHVELCWREGNAFRHEQVSIEGEGNAAIVSAAVRLVPRARTARRGIVLALAPSLFESRQLLLNGIADDEVRAVLARKAANALGVGLEECAFQAQRCATPQSDAGQATWLVRMRRRSEHLDLLVRMRGAGLRVRRVIATRDVLVQPPPGIEPGVASIVVVHTGRAVHTHLLRGGELFQESCVPLARFEERAEAYPSVVRDVRQLAAFWAKASRGAGLEALYLGGFSEGELEALRLQLAIAAQGAEPRVLGRPRSGWSDVRAGLLEALHAGQTAAADLDLPLPPRPSRVLALAGLSAVLLAAVGWEASAWWTARRDERESEIRAALAAAGDCVSDQRVCDEYLEARDSLWASVASLARVARGGLTLEHDLREIEACVGSDVELRHLTLEATPEGTRVLLEGRLAASVERAAQRLEELRGRAVLASGLRDVLVEPSSRVPEAEHAEPLSFTLSGFVVEEGA